MQVLVRSKSFHITDALRDYIERQAAQLDKGTWNPLRVEASLEKTRQQARALIKVVCPHCKPIVVQKVSGDIYQAVAEAVDRSHRALRKQRERVLTSRRQRAFS
jgi:ribosomal subunit interface protein